MSAITPSTAEEQAAAHGVTVDEWKADRLGVLAQSLADRSQVPHGVFLCSALGKRPETQRVWSLTMGDAMGDTLLRTFEPRV